MPHVYEHLRFRFSYPENWILDEGESLDERLSVSVHSPGGAFWSVMLLPPSEDPAKLGAEVVAAMREEYPHLDAEQVTETIAERELVGWDMNFFYLDLTSTAMVRSLGTPHGTYVIHCQAEDREFAQMELVFRAITTSLLRTL